MPWKISWSEEAVRSLSRTGQAEAKRIVKKLEAVSENPRHFLERLSGREDYKLRVGDYRLIVLLLHREKTIFVENLGHRKSVYKKT